VILRQRGGKTAVNQCNATAPANGVPCSGGTEHAASGWCRKRPALVVKHSAGLQLSTTVTLMPAGRTELWSHSCWSSEG
jgi:hypothetical protein